MTKDAVIEAQTREETGTGAARRLRRAGVLPGVLGKRDGASVPIVLNHHDFDMMLRGHSGESMLVDITIDGEKPLKVLLSEIQRHPVTGRTQHADFIEISMTEKMHLAIAVKLVGEPVGVMTGGGLLDHLLREVEVQCLPADVIDAIEIDVTGLEIGDSVRVQDLVVSDKLTILTASDVAVAAVAAPTVVVEEEEEDAEEEGEEGAEPAVIGEEEEEKDKGEESSE
jgi:large subunit ribosomal protein L25